MQEVGQCAGGNLQLRCNVPDGLPFAPHLPDTFRLCGCDRPGAAAFKAVCAAFLTRIDVQHHRSQQGFNEEVLRNLTVQSIVDDRIAHGQFHARTELRAVFIQRIPEVLEDSEAVAAVKLPVVHVSSFLAGKAI